MFSNPVKNMLRRDPTHEQRRKHTDDSDTALPQAPAPGRRWKLVENRCDPAAVLPARRFL